MNLTDRQRRTIVSLGLRHVFGEVPSGARVDAILETTRALPSPAQLIDAMVRVGAQDQNVVDIRRALLRKKLETLVSDMLTLHMAMSGSGPIQSLSR
jgi:hypothetical protein